MTTTNPIDSEKYPFLDRLLKRCSVTSTSTEEDARKHLDLMKWNISSGPDEIQVGLNVMKKCPNMIPWLCKLYEKSIRNGHCPQYWNDAHTTAIHNRCVRSKCGNYRPISLTSQVVKLMERIVIEKLWQHVLENDLINTHQHGFRSGRSCVTQLLECFHQWTDDQNMGKGTHTIYMDFSKAFDCVSDPHLLYKLHHYGIRGKLLLWLNTFLTNQRQKGCPSSTQCNACLVPCCVRCSTGNDIWTCAFPNLRERHSGVFQHQRQRFHR